MGARIVKCHRTIQRIQRHAATQGIDIQRADFSKLDWRRERATMEGWGMMSFLLKRDVEEEADVASRWLGSGG
jgi:hypothetical protein